MADRGPGFDTLSFKEIPLTTGFVLTGHYGRGLVVLSVFIAIIAAYASVYLANWISVFSGRKRLFWLFGGAAALGAGGWAVDCVSMQALHLPVQVWYDWPTVLVSLLAAISTSAVFLFVSTRLTISPVAAALGSVTTGFGILAMHFTGMAAMRLPARFEYSPGIVFLSIVLAVASSYLALRITSSPRVKDPLAWRHRLSGAFILGIAISFTQYMGLGAVSFVGMPFMNASLRHAVNVSVLDLASIVALSFVFLGTVCVTSLVERFIASQEQELAKSRLQLQTVFDNMADALMVWDREARVMTLNRAATDLMGLPDRSAITQHPDQPFQLLTENGEVLPFELWPGVRALRGEFLKNFRIAVRRKDTGKTVHVEVNTAPISGQAGEDNQVIVTYRDITERHQLDEAQARLAAIVEYSRDAIISNTDAGIVTSWNRGAQKILGYTSEEMIGQSILKLLPPDRRHEEKTILDRLKRGETVEHFETIRIRKDGAPIHISLTTSPIRDANGAIVGASKIGRDITDRVALEQQLRQSQKMEAIGQLSGGIAHDFNNLLGVVIGNLELLERLVGDNERALQRLKAAQKASLRGADLTRRLLAFSSNRPLAPAMTKLHDCIHNVIEMSARVIGSDIKLVTNFTASVAEIFVDAASLESALLNLVVNARDAMPRGGAITIATSIRDLEESYAPVQAAEVHAGRFVCISVTDTGEGMSRETMERAFEPFFTTKPRGKSTGLGLAMVYGFVKQSGGTTRMYSEVGFGTTVALYLPLPVRSESASHAVATEAVSCLPGGKVLVVDDESELVEIAAAYLDGLGFQTLQANDGASALEIIAARDDLDLLITDIVMPGGMSGVEMAERARQLNPRLKVVYSSGFPADALTEKGMSLADSPMLHKPYQRAEFCSLIARLINSHTEPLHRTDANNL